MDQPERLFSAIDKMERNYTWEYTTIETVIELFDVNNEFFAMITKKREIADETGVASDYRDNTWFCWYLYSKSTLSQVEGLPELEIKESYKFDPTEGKMQEIGKERLLDEIMKKPWGTSIKKVDSVILDVGKIYILDGNLVIDRV